MPGKISIVPGERYGRLTLLGEVERCKGRRRMRVRCDCGELRDVNLSALRSGKSRSCGCLQRESVTTHGGKGSPEYMVWVNMRHRCVNPKAANYLYYGGRGITVCERWASFENFIVDMGPRPSPRHTIDRVDNDKGYFPENCQWATAQEQARNRRSSQMITHNGRTQCRAAWAQELGISYSTLSGRIHRGWSINRALTT